MTGETSSEGSNPSLSVGLVRLQRSTSRTVATLGGCWGSGWSNRPRAGRFKAPGPRFQRSALRGRPGRVGLVLGALRDRAGRCFTVVRDGSRCGFGFRLRAWVARREAHGDASDEALTTRLDVCSSGVTDGGWRPTRARRAPICERRGVPPPRARRLVQLFLGLILYGVSDAMLLLARPRPRSVGRPAPGPLAPDRARRRHLGDHRRSGGAAALDPAAPAPGDRHAVQRPGRRGGDRPRCSRSCTPPHALAARVALLVGGVVLNGVATGAYIGAGLGPGPAGRADDRLGRAGDTRSASCAPRSSSRCSPPAGRSAAPSASAPWSTRWLDRPARAPLHPAARRHRGRPTPPARRAGDRGGSYGRQPLEEDSRSSQRSNLPRDLREPRATVEAEPLVQPERGGVLGVDAGDHRVLAERARRARSAPARAPSRCPAPRRSARTWTECSTV